MHIPFTHLQLATQIANLYAALPQVEAVAMSGSHGHGPGTTDASSDIDLYIYTREEIPVETRRNIMQATGGSTRSDLNLNYWGLGDEWFNAPTGIELDVNYFDFRWMEDQIIRVMEKYQASLGYTTCFCYTVHQSRIFYDPRGWFSQLQEKCTGEYPQTLRQNIITLNHPVLRGIIPAYTHQLEKAVQRHDLVSVNHRLAALLASYFDILFAINRQLHPGEKRQVEFALRNCPLIPLEMERDLESILLCPAAELSSLTDHVNRLLDHLDQLLRDGGFYLA